MSEEPDFEKLTEDGKPVDSFDYRNAHDEDDYFSITLYQMPDGRYFRFVTASGFNSAFDGATGVGDWVADPSDGSWKEP